MLAVLESTVSPTACSRGDRLVLMLGNANDKEGIEEEEECIDVTAPGSVSIEEAEDEPGVGRGDNIGGDITFSRGVLFRCLSLRLRKRLILVLILPSVDGKTEDTVQGLLPSVSCGCDYVRTSTGRREFTMMLKTHNMVEKSEQSVSLIIMAIVIVREV